MNYDVLVIFCFSPVIFFVSFRNAFVRIGSTPRHHPDAIITTRILSYSFVYGSGGDPGFHKPSFATSLPPSWWPRHMNLVIGLKPGSWIVPSRSLTKIAPEKIPFDPIGKANVFTIFQGKGERLPNHHFSGERLVFPTTIFQGRAVKLRGCSSFLSSSVDVFFFFSRAS